MSGFFEAENGSTIDDLLQARPSEHKKEHGKMMKRIQMLEDGRVPAKEATIGN